MSCLAQGQRLPTLHLASGIGTTLGELAGLAAAASRRPLEVTTGPARDFDVDRFVGDPDLARRILGWTCGISLRDGFDRLVAEFAEMQAGEVAGVVKKMIRDDGGALSRERTQKLIDELSDVLWYAAEIATLLDINLSSVARRNIEKLADRAERGVIKGSGDNR